MPLKSRNKNIRLYLNSIGVMSEKPKKPLNAYFKFRGEKLADFDKDEENKMDKVKKAWEGLDPKIKSQMEADYHKQLEVYKVDLEAWNKDNKGAAKEEKPKSKPKDSKPEKAKGAKPGKKGKDSDEEEKEKEKSDKKGKKEAEKRGQSKKEEKPAGRDKSKKK
jgi:hypothetical protein